MKGNYALALNTHTNNHKLHEQQLYTHIYTYIICNEIIITHALFKYPLFFGY